MKAVIMRSVICLAAMAVVVAAFGASAAPILVDFESDPVLVNVPNRFTSSDSSQIHFSDTIGANLIVLEVDGSNALATFFDDDSGLLIEFDFIASALSMDFGNTSLASFGDTAVLTVFMGEFEVGSPVSVLLNLTDSIDQTISFDGALFDSATLKYDVAAGLTEVVDNLHVTPIPEPHAALVFGMGMLLVGAVCRRRSPSEVELRSVHE